MIVRLCCCANKKARLDRGKIKRVMQCGSEAGGSGCCFCWSMTSCCLFRARSIIPVHFRTPYFCTKGFVV